MQNAEGIALPRNERFRYYVDFEMIADVKLRDNNTIGFVLRATDPQNYYLLQISGAGAPEPQTATLYAVKNGQRQYINSATTVAFTKTLASPNGFRVIIKGDNTGIAIWIKDSDTGKTNGVGLLTDQYNTFKKGSCRHCRLSKFEFRG